MAFVNNGHEALGGAFRVKVNFGRELRRSKERIEHRLQDRVCSAQDKPMFSAKNIHYEISSRARAITAGGIGAMQQLAQRLGLAKAIDDRLQVLKVHAIVDTPRQSTGTVHAQFAVVDLAGCPQRLLSATDALAPTG